MLTARFAPDGTIVYGAAWEDKPPEVFATHPPDPEARPLGVSLWFFTNRIEAIYDALKARQLRTARATLADAPVEESEVRFQQDLFEPFYGGRQFNIEDPNGLALIFWQPARLSSE